MDKKLAGLIGAVGALSAVGQAQAAPTLDEVMRVESYADLLRPIPNATALLSAADARQAAPAAEVLEVQYYHHHHHHYRYYRPGYYAPPPFRGYARPGFYHHHHHHHHHHHGIGVFIR